MSIMSNIVRKALVLWACTARAIDRLHCDRRLRQGWCIGAGGAEFCAFLRCFSGKREKDQVSIGSGWWQWTQQASARIHSAGALAGRLRRRRAPRRSSHAVARRARAALPASPRPPRRFARAEPTTEFVPFVAAGAGGVRAGGIAATRI